MSYLLKALCDLFDEIKCWMANNFLQLNQSKSKILGFRPTRLILGSPSSSATFNFGSFPVSVQPHVRNLGFTLDSVLWKTSQLSGKRQFPSIEIYRKSKQFLSPKDLETVIHPFITSWLDYCNSLYCGLPQSAITRLQVGMCRYQNFMLWLIDWAFIMVYGIITLF